MLKEFVLEIEVNSSRTIVEYLSAECQDSRGSGRGYQGMRVDGQLVHAPGRTSSDERDEQRQLITQTLCAPKDTPLHFPRQFAVAVSFSILCMILGGIPWQKVARTSGLYLIPGLVDLHQ